MKVIIGKEDCRAAVDVPFLVTTESFTNPVLRFNAVKLLSQEVTGETRMKMFESALKGISTGRCESLVNLLQIDLSAGKIVLVPCKANIGVPPTKQACDFRETKQS